ncbi:hypothetical protein C8F04DRAFT_1121178 [Mycena alexandri]|uniref:Uncharacterized protein n=1 Tax=Mycena alexandri TaxID=1745969 RepID=A0AAD6WX56_9AGAR|nr:hypothetical protein C8F04DRAFT_1121178 [Mycena alexandri]
MTDRLPKPGTYVTRCEARGERTVTRTGEECERVGFGLAGGRPTTLQRKRSEPTLRRQASRVSPSEHGSVPYGRSVVATGLGFGGAEVMINEFNKRSEASPSRKTSRTLKERTTPASVQSHTVTEERLQFGGGDSETKAFKTTRSDARLSKRADAPIFVDSIKSKLTVRVSRDDLQLISQSGRRENEHLALALEREELALEAEGLELDRAQLVLDRKRLELDRERLRVTQLKHTYESVLSRRELGKIGELINRMHSRS